MHCLFSGQHRDAVEKYLLETFGDNFPGVDPDYVQLAERIRFAVLKLSEGDLKKLQAAIERTAVDWRDTLMAVDFAVDQSIHLAWKPDYNHEN